MTGMPDTPLDALREFIAACGSQTTAAKKLHVSPQFISQILRGHRSVPETILNKLGWKTVITLRKRTA